VAVVMMTTAGGCTTRVVRGGWDQIVAGWQNSGWRVSGAGADHDDDAAKAGTGQSLLQRAAASETPQATAGRNHDDPLNLRRYPGMYSLQIAVYDKDYGPNFRDAAEQAARTLRKQGQEAYYYHGPNRSMVTLGLFDYDTAFDSVPGRQDTYSQRVRALQEKYPHNLLNGRTIIEKSPGKPDSIQPSFLVRVF